MEHNLGGDELMHQLGQRLGVVVEENVPRAVVAPDKLDALAGSLHVLPHPLERLQALKCVRQQVRFHKIRKMT